MHATFCDQPNSMGNYIVNFKAHKWMMVRNIDEEKKNYELHEK